jgi:hypothetical protein
VTRLAGLLAVALQLGAAYAVMGTPDLRAAAAFWDSTAPTLGDSVAAAQLVLWLALLVALAVALIAAVRAAAGTLSTRRGATWSVAVVVAGLVILAAGAADHVRAQGSAPTVSGGSLAQAEAQLGR